MALIIKHLSRKKEVSLQKKWKAINLKLKPYEESKSFLFDELLHQQDKSKEKW